MFLFISGAVGQTMIGYILAKLMSPFDIVASICSKYLIFRKSIFQKGIIFTTCHLLNLILLAIENNLYSRKFINLILRSYI